MKTEIEKQAQIKKIIKMRDALVNDDKETQKEIVREHLDDMWVEQLSTNLEAYECDWDEEGNLIVGNKVEPWTKGD